MDGDTGAEEFLLRGLDLIVFKIMNKLNPTHDICEIHFWKLSSFGRACLTRGMPSYGACGSVTPLGDSTSQGQQGDSIYHVHGNHGALSEAGQNVTNSSYNVLLFVPTSIVSEFLTPVRLQLLLQTTIDIIIRYVIPGT